MGYSWNIDTHLHEKHWTWFQFAEIKFGSSCMFSCNYDDVITNDRLCLQNLPVLIIFIDGTPSQDLGARKNMDCWDSPRTGMRNTGICYWHSLAYTLSLAKCFFIPCNWRGSSCKFSAASLMVPFHCHQELSCTVNRWFSFINFASRTQPVTALTGLTNWAGCIWM